ncbi:MAG TPA: flagellar hook-basal body complex protein FliE [Rhodoferax sp.]|jgi:flagellar hook-basal body complex protein FliE|nr:flagellar hook-basal body complex protein FliE [Rhodoferax sp.]HQC85260.1 flagellar hook-basal body complex protein FliE [Rhodoferax sp.]
MDLKLTPVSMPTAVRPGGGIKPAGSAGTQGVGGGFSTALKSALNSVSAAQNESTRLQQEVQMENPKVSLEETMVAIQKAQIGFQATLHVRNRMVQAYTDIMNMQV